VKTKAQTKLNVLVAHFSTLDDIARGVADGDIDLDRSHTTGQSKLNDEERRYVEQKAKRIRRKRHNKKLAERIEAREREAEEQDQLKARANNVEPPNVKLWEHPFYKLLAAKYSRTVPVGRMPIAYERWSYFVSGNLVDRLILCQLVYWFRPRKWTELEIHPGPRARLVNPDNDYEVAKTDEEMGAEIGVSARTVEGRRKVLVKRGLIKVRYKKFAGKRTCHYSIDWDSLADAYWDGGGDTNTLKLPKPSNVVSECDDDEDEDDEEPPSSTRG
jgi:hypothetical protein